MASALRLFVVLTLALFLPAGSAAAEEDALVRAAKKEGTLSWYSFIRKSVNQEVARLWAKAYPDIRLLHTRKGTGDQVPAVEAERMAKRVRVDVMNNTDPATFLRWKREGFLASFRLPNDRFLIEGHVDKEGHYRTLVIFLHVGAYNTKKVKASEAPRKLTDLLDAKWRGRTVSATPRTSGVEFPQFLTAVNRYGWGLVQGLAKNNHLLQKSQGAVLLMVVKGERDVALGNSSYRLFEEMKMGRPVAPIFYEDGTVMITPRVASPKEAPHPNAAKLFINFLLSKPVQELFVKDHFYSARRDAGKPDSYPRRGLTGGCHSCWEGTRSLL